MDINHLFFIYAFQILFLSIVLIKQYTNYLQAKMAI